MDLILGKEIKISQAMQPKKKKELPKSIVTLSSIFVNVYSFFFFFLKWTSYLIRFFARSSEYYFVRVNSIRESKHRAEVALELRDSFDSSQNL